MEQGDLAGKVAIVTGSSTGIGAAVALGLARRGANIVVNYTHSQAEAETTADAVRQAGADVRLVQGDVASDAHCRRPQRRPPGKAEPAAAAGRRRRDRQERAVPGGP